MTREESRLSCPQSFSETEVVEPRERSERVVLSTGNLVDRVARGPARAIYRAHTDATASPAPSGLSMTIGKRGFLDEPREKLGW